MKTEMIEMWNSQILYSKNHFLKRGVALSELNCASSRVPLTTVMVRVSLLIYNIKLQRNVAIMADCRTNRTIE